MPNLTRLLLAILLALVAVALPGCVASYVAPVYAAPLYAEPYPCDPSFEDCYYFDGLAYRPLPRRVIVGPVYMAPRRGYIQRMPSRTSVPRQSAQPRTVDP